MVAELSSLGWILAGGLLMSMVAMVGALTLLLPARALQRLLMPLVSLAAGSLLGGALFHMLPEGMGAIGARAGSPYVAAGFSAFLALELFLQWHHSHRNPAAGGPSGPGPERRPLAVLILLGDALHNFIGGLGIASTFVLNPAAGVAAWCAALAHEIPQELGDFGILLHSGWTPRAALRWNFISALTFPLGALLAWLLAQSLSVAGLALFASGNFLYIAASDLVPEIKSSSSLRSGAIRFGWFSAGLLLMLVLARCVPVPA
ncbi:MAG: ZIP family metal transporter [Cyanobium sp. M30B3]|nr:MAG: ZIP family metal transporter [Cyanobium sp. M30B3]